MVRGTRARGPKFKSPPVAGNVDQGLEDEAQPEPELSTSEDQLNATSGIPDPTTAAAMTEGTPSTVLPRDVFNVAPTQMRQPLKPPRVGRLIYQDKSVEPFTGGSNLTPFQYFPQHSEQHRPSKYNSVHDFEDKLSKGMEFKLGEDGENNGIQLTFWFNRLATNLELLGLDTVFKIPQPGWTEEINLAVDWGQCRESLVKPWIKSLNTGVYNEKQQKMFVSCPYDHQNLYYSGLYILASLTTRHCFNMLREPKPKPDGPEVLVHVLKIRMNLFLSKQRILIAELEALCITQQDQENVRVFNEKIRSKCEHIVQTGNTPQHLALLVAKQFLASQVDPFQRKMFDVANELERDPEKYSWVDILNKTQEHYHNMRDYWTPAGKATTVSVSKKEFQNFINMTNQWLNNLKLKNQPQLVVATTITTTKQYVGIAENRGSRKAMTNVQTQEQAYSHQKSIRRKMVDPVTTMEEITTIQMKDKIRTIGLTMMKGWKMGRISFCAANASTKTRRVMECGTRAPILKLTKPHNTRLGTNQAEESAQQQQMQQTSSNRFLIRIHLQGPRLS